jgi:hypothetical protein
MKIVINPKWLTACGYVKWIDVPVDVVAVDDYGPGRKMYRVTLPDGRDWTVWAIRGVREIE